MGEGFRFKLRTGSTIPTLDDLESYELGYCTSNSTLYINDNGTIKILAIASES